MEMEELQSPGVGLLWNVDDSLKFLLVKRLKKKKYINSMDISFSRLENIFPLLGPQRPNNPYWGLCLPFVGITSKNRGWTLLENHFAIKNQVLVANQAHFYEMW